MARPRPLPRSTPLAIVGSGPHGLALAVRLSEHGRAGEDELVVLDPSGRWLDTWRHHFRSLAIPTLRSPGVHHPGTDASGLGAWAQQRGRRSTAAYAQPHADVFEHYCDHLIQEHGLEERVVPSRVTMLGTCGRVATLLLDDGRLLEAGRVVLATNPGRRRIPHWVLDLRPVPPGILAHSGEVDLTQVCVRGQRVVVVGGGLTAAHLAIGAVERGAEAVHLLSRRRVRRSTFDTDPGWLGPKELDGFSQLSAVERADAVLVARDGGSVPDGIANRLTALRKDGRLHLREETRVLSARTVDHRPDLFLSDETRLRPDRIWLATGTEPCVEACTLLDDVRRSHPCGVHHGFPDLDADLSWPGTPIHLSGRLASLQLGPAAGNLWGARKAAERIAAAADATSTTVGAAR